NALPTVTANTTATAVCNGDMVTLTGAGADTYVWDNGVTDGTAFAPTATTTYTVTGTDLNSCSNTASTIVTFNALPTVTASSTSAAVCAGDMVTLTGAGADTYVWDNNITDGTAFAPTATTTYTVTGTDLNNCSNTAFTTVTFNALPSVTASTTASVVCAGDMVTLTGAGADTYVWDNSVTDDVAFAATATTTYTVIGTDVNNCTNTDDVEVTVNALPTVTANTTSSAVCDGDMVTLTGSGADSYVWDNSVTDAVAFTPATTTTYTVTGTDANTNCTNTASATVTVTIVGITTTVTNETITADNASATYQWIDCNNNNAPIAGETAQSFTATVNGDYAVIVTENNCSETSACVNIMTVGLETLKTGNNLSVYPNPARENITLTSGSDFNGAIVKVISLTGQTLIATKINSGNSHSIDMSTYAPGLYFIEVNQNGEVSRMKVMKN
ncbi:MAG: T9SS type A sorting domain-containing protein, partial [Bacteroidota bacterium]|nr:T9SS type A sorting domain-containing protein [Bacteroidota bacterium]